jgi:phosphoserine phosphatase
MRICFDLDNTLCVGKPYEFAKPLPGAADLLRSLKNKGHTIIIYTARGMGSCTGCSGMALAKIGKITFDQRGCLR